MTDQLFGAGPLVPVEFRDETEQQLSVAPYEDRLTAPAVGGSVALTHGPLVAQNTLVRDIQGNEYVLGLDYMETLATTPGRIENLSIPEGTQLVVSYFYYRGGTENVVSPVSAPTRFSTLLKYGG